MDGVIMSSKIVRKNCRELKRVRWGPIIARFEEDKFNSISFLIAPVSSLRKAKTSPVHGLRLGLRRQRMPVGTRASKRWLVTDLTREQMNSANFAAEPGRSEGRSPSSLRKCVSFVKYAMISLLTASQFLSFIIFRY